MPRKVFNDKNIARGKNFRKVCEYLFPKASREKIGAFLGGVPGTTVHTWEDGSSIANRALVELERRGVSLTWLLTSEGDMMASGAAPAAQPEGVKPDLLPAVKQDEVQKVIATRIPDTETPVDKIPRGNAIRRKGDEDKAHKVLHLKTIGNAAALMKGTGHREGFDDEGLYWQNTVEIPESTHLVKVRGTSMEPQMMHGQSVMVGTEYRTWMGEVPRDRELVIVKVLIQDSDIGGVDGEWEGVHCKRVHDGGDFWHFTSINPAGESFTVAKDNCRLWHVIGVYYGEKSAIPEED